MWLIGDNVSTKESLANIAGRPLIGCASHRFQLSLRDILDEGSELIDKIQKK